MVCVDYEISGNSKIEFLKTDYFSQAVLYFRLP